MPSPERGAIRLVIASFVLAIIASVVLILTPTNSSASGSSASSGSVVVSYDTETLLESEGGMVLLLLAIPAALFGIPLVVAGQPRRGPIWIAIAALTTLGVLLALASIGLFYVPSVAALWFAIGMDRRTSVG